MTPEERESYVERRARALEEVQKLLAGTVDYRGDPADIEPDTSLFGTGLGLDSLDAVEVLIGLEVDFGIHLEGTDAQRHGLRSVNALVDLLMRSRGELP
jgi:acyl carrier protein